VAKRPFVTKRVDDRVERAPARRRVEGHQGVEDHPGTRELRFHAAQLARGLGGRPIDADGARVWDGRRRGRARFLMGMAGWDESALRRASFCVVRDHDDGALHQSLTRALLLEAAAGCPTP
jgi:hypothetical protein